MADKPVLITQKTFNRIAKAVKTTERLARRSTRYPSKHRHTGGGGTPLYPAITQEGLQSDGKLSVKLQDSSGVATGDAFDVFVTADKGPITPEQYSGTDGTDLNTSGKDVLISKDSQGYWYLIEPSVFKGDIYRVAAQESLQTDGKISCKLLDSSGNPTGTAFDVYAFADKRGTIEPSDYVTADGNEIALNTRLLVCRDQFGVIYVLNSQIVHSQIRRVKTQEAVQSDGTVSVKALNSSGAVIGSAFDVYILASKSSITVADWIASDGQDITASGVYMIVNRDSMGDYYVVSPTMLKTEACS